MVLIEEISEYLASVAPLTLQADYDNVGLIVGDPKRPVEGVLITLDITLEVLQEAKERKANLVISHHPPIFRALKKIREDDPVGQLITYAIQHNIALYSIHTNLDHLPHGVNKHLADRLGLHSLAILQPLSGFQLKDSIEAGAGMIGYLQVPLLAGDLLEHLKQVLELSCLRHTAFPDKPLEKIALCGGSGGALFSVAKAEGADAFITADIKYHQFFEATRKTMLIDIGHYESEVGTKALIYQLLSKKFTKIALLEATTITNPIQYYV